MSYVNSPHSEEGLYGIVDVGAGTTDVSFFRLADIQRDQPRLMAFYDAATEVIGSDEIDRAIATLAIRRAGLPQQTPRLAALLAASKSAKEQLDQKPNVRVSLNGSSVTLSRTEVAASAASIIDKMAGNYVETNRRSYRKEPLVGRWASFTVFFLGGGTRLKMIEEKLRRTRPSPYNHTINYKRIPVPQDLELLADAKSNFDLVAVAYGLSFPPLDFPNILNPSQVGPISFNLRCDSRPDRDELYPK
jgi:molecular chaperone DnaK (HSP70)